ncbi:MAG: alkaline phosphatase family protein [Chloroflexi bacterium]|nr:alkaline phosphatase family protein [Chloroflexota bacterium]
MKSIIIGFDAFDPARFESLVERGDLPNLRAFMEQGAYRRLGISNPAQSEVSWSSIATGLNPGGHGLFDFVHRNPATYALEVSLLPVKESLVGTQFVRPHSARTFFDHAVENGYPAASLWWPATFPARLDSPIQSIPGLGTPDIHGKLGVGVLLTADLPGAAGIEKTTIDSLENTGVGVYRGRLPGPRRKNGEQAWLAVEVAAQGAQVALKVGKQQLILPPGEWSPVLELAFPVGRLGAVRFVTRALVNLTPAVRVYFLPLQLHPFGSPWPYAAPSGFIKNVWKAHGPFLTLGWPQDTTGLNEGILNDVQFLALCDDIIATRERVFLQQLSRFTEGALAVVFDTLDRVQHMFWRGQPEVIDAWYRKLDILFGRILAAVPKDTRIVLVSDHGFANYEHKVHLNAWLARNGHLAPRNGGGSLEEVDWKKSSVYAVGLNSLYLNLQGREGQGILPLAEVDAKRRALRDALLVWKGPDSRQVVSAVALREEAIEGPLARLGPDLLVGYAPGYRASSETGLGKWGAEVIEPNRDHWAADHCIDPTAVPGVVFANHGLEDLPHPTYTDLPELVLGEPFERRPGEPPADLAAEDQRTIEERLSGLGYL